MSMETYTASLHSGLIQRARPAPARVVSLRDGDFLGPRANILPLRGGDFGARPAAPLRGTEIRPERTPMAPVQPEAGARAGWSFRRRFGLTVRVGSALRELLLRARMHTGRTTQSILHDALVNYLALIERDRGQR